MMMFKPIRISWIQLLVVLLSCVSTGLAAVLISLHFNDVTAQRLREERRISDQKLCAVVVMQNRAYKAREATLSETGKTLAKALEDLATSLHCPE